MEKQRELHQTLILAFILLAGTGLFLWQAGFFSKESKKPICSKEYINFCTTEDICTSKGFYWWDNSCHLAEKPQPKPSEYPDYDSLKDLIPLIIIEDKVSWSPEAKSENITGYRKQLESMGQFARIYFYAEASVNNKPLTQYETLYVKFNNTGGHLFRPQSLKIPADTITRLLYAINNIPYLSSIPYSESKIPLTTNWFNFFKDDSLITVDVFISSLKPAVINKIMLYYDCAEGSDCKIELK